MIGERVMDFRGDAGGGEMRAQSIAGDASDDVLMNDVVDQHDGVAVG